MSWIAVGAIAVGAGASIYGAASQPGGVESPDPRARPMGVESILGQLSVETLYELGVPYEGLEDELLQRKISEFGRKSGFARSTMEKINRLRRLVSYPETMGSSKDDVDQLLRQINRQTRIAGVLVESDGKSVTLNFSGPERQMLEQIKAKEAQANVIKQNRLKAQDQLNKILGDFSDDANGQLPGETSAANYLNTFLDEQFRTESDKILAQANKLGISPGGQLGDLQRALETERTKIASGGALERALALAGGQQAILQKGLVPANAQTVLSYAGQASESQLGSQALAQQLSIADAEAKAARAAGISNLGSSLIGAGGSVLSSRSLAEALGKEEKK